MLYKIGNYEVQTELFRSWISMGFEKGHREGLKEGLKEGILEGLHLGELAALIDVLDSRGIQLDKESHQRLEACKDMTQLRLWLHKALTVHTARELFDSEPTPQSPARKSAKRGRSPSTSKPRSRR
ncbi:MAG TPA: hypothetical protein VK539_31535 [Myxococcaceae bacterium]|nr:hypothetical protein [Myxococcaceae bacterium]